MNRTNPKRIEKITKKYMAVRAKYDAHPHKRVEDFDVEGAFVTFLFQSEKLNLLYNYAVHNNSVAGCCKKKLAVKLGKP